MFLSVPSLHKNPTPVGLLFVAVMLLGPLVPLVVALFRRDRLTRSEAAIAVSLTLAGYASLAGIAFIGHMVQP